MRFFWCLCLACGMLAGLDAVDVLAQPAGWPSSVTITSPTGFDGPSSFVIPWDSFRGAYTTVPGSVDWFELMGVGGAVATVSFAGVGAFDDSVTFISQGGDYAVWHLASVTYPPLLGSLADGNGSTWEGGGAAVSFLVPEPSVAALVALAFPALIRRSIPRRCSRASW